MQNATALAPARDRSRHASELALERLLVEEPVGVQLAVADFVGWYRGNTRHAYCQDLTTFLRWCAHLDGGAGVDPLTVDRLTLERYARHLVDVRGNSHATMRRRMQTLGRFYTLAAADRRIAASPATHVRLPSRYSAPDEPTKTYLDRYQLAKLLGHARTGWRAEPALVALLGLLGLRVGEALALQIEDYRHIGDGHRLLRFTGKGGKPATIPLPVPVLRLLDDAADGRATGPLLVRRNGQPYNYRAALRVIARLAAEIGVDGITPHALRRSFATAALDAGVSIRDTQTAGRWNDPRMVMRYDQGRHSLDRHAAYTVATYIAGAA